MGRPKKRLKSRQAAQAGKRSDEHNGPLHKKASKFGASGNEERGSNYIHFQDMENTG